MKKANCITFINIFNTIHAAGITTKDALMADQLLYTDFWFALKDFCHFALLSKTGGKNNEGEILPGNSGKIDALEIRGVTTRDEIETECVIKIVEKLDWVLRQPIEKQKNYCYVICNNMLNDCFRQLPPNDFKFVSLNSTIEGAGIDAEDASPYYQDIIPDFTYDPDHVFFEKETIKELTEVLKAKRAREQEEKKEAILREIALLNKHPAEMITRLGVKHIGMKPRQLANMIVSKGCELAYAEIIFEVSKRNGIALAEIRQAIAGHELNAAEIKADTNNTQEVACQISRLKYRADKRLSK